MTLKHDFDRNIEAIRLERDTLDKQLKEEESNSSRNSYVKFTNEYCRQRGRQE